MTHSPHQNTPDPEDYIPSFRRRNLDTSGFMKNSDALPAAWANLSSDSFMYFITFGNPNTRPNGLK